MSAILSHDPGFSARLELLITDGDVMYCPDCQEWHEAPPMIYGRPWSDIQEHGYPLARPCDFAEALDCMAAGQQMIALDFGLPWIWMYRNGSYGAVALSEVKHDGGEDLTIYAGEIMFNPRPREMFRRVFYRLNRWIPFVPRYPIGGQR